VLTNPGDLRIGPVLATPAVLKELGVSPRQIFNQAGVNLDLFQDPDGRIAIEDLGRLFEASVAATTCGHFGLLVGERFDLQGLGPIGYLMRHSATVGDALRSLILHLHLYDGGAAPVLLAPEPSCAILGYSIYRHNTPAAAQVYDAAIAIGGRILRELCGPTWKPLRVQFSHVRPKDTEPFHRLFGSDIRFDAEVSGIVFTTTWLRRPIEGADATLHDLIAGSIRRAEAQMSFSEQVQSVIHQMVLSGAATANAVSHLFGIHERTLRHRLHEEGTNLRFLINEARFELAQQLLDNTGLSVAEIAASLNYADPNAFTRAFTNRAGLSPTRWRAQRLPLL